MEKPLFLSDDIKIKLFNNLRSTTISIESILNKKQNLGGKFK